MHVITLLTALALAQEADPFAGLDRALAKEISSWKKGVPPPRKLLQFPDDPPRLFPHCGMRAYGTAVEDYVYHINDQELLKVFLFDPQTNDACVWAAARRLLELRGVNNVREIVADRRKTNSADFGRTELATFVQLLASPYARIRVALLDKKDAPKETAESALFGLKADLTAGVPWERAYETAAKLLPDKQGIQKSGGWTFLCYRYAGLISPTGFDLLDRRIDDKLDPGHIRRLFEAKGGVHRFETADAYWLYYVEAFYDSLPSQLKKQLTEAEAIRLAEQFIVQNGYTDLPAIKDKTKLSYEGIDFSDPDDRLKQRFNTLERKAYGVRNGDVKNDGWTIVFRYNANNERARRIIPNRDQRIKTVGRAVTMEADGSDIRMQHQEIYLKGLKVIRSGDK